MKLPTIAILAASALTLAPAFAQRTPEGQAPQGQAPQGQAVEPPVAAPADVSDAELETFATIYVDLLQTVAKFEPQMKAAQSEEQAREIQTQVQTESIAKVAQRGWTPEKFNSVTDAINRSQTLSDKAAKLIEEKS
jgi:hypothetical protein